MDERVNAEHPTGLIRAIGRWSLTALIVNSIIGSGVFGLPSAIAQHVGQASPWAVLIAAVGMGIMMACFAEVASQFRDAGGPYLYAREAFGRFVGLQMGWITWVVRLTAAAANSNLFVDYLGEFWPATSTWSIRAGVLTALIAGLAVINFRGVKAGANTSSIFAVAKLAPLLIFIVFGVFFLFKTHSTTVLSTTSGDWPKALLLLAFAYGGFDSALIPVGEVKNPRKDVPFGLFVALAVVASIYLLIQLVVVSALPSPGDTRRPLADAARVFIGAGGATLISVGALVSVYGYLSANMLNAPRLTFAFAERKDFPSFFGSIHPRFHTPHISIVVFAALLLCVSLIGSFQWNASLSGVARLFAYSTVCGALIKLRKNNPDADAFRLRFGPVFAVFGILFSLYLLSAMTLVEVIIMASVIAIAFLHWLTVRNSNLEKQKGVGHTADADASSSR